MLKVHSNLAKTRHISSHVRGMHARPGSDEEGFYGVTSVVKKGRFRVGGSLGKCQEHCTLNWMEIMGVAIASLLLLSRVLQACSTAPVGWWKACSTGLSRPLF